MHLLSMKEKFTQSPNCFFSDLGNINLPFTSTLQLYVPIRLFIYIRDTLKYIEILPLFTTFYHIINKFNCFDN